jgi:hypothetical protein
VNGLARPDGPVPAAAIPAGCARPFSRRDAAHVHRTFTGGKPAGNLDGASSDRARMRRIGRAGTEENHGQFSG